MIAHIGSIRLMWPRSGNAFAFRRRPYCSRLAAGATGGWVDLGPKQLQSVNQAQPTFNDCQIQKYRWSINARVQNEIKTKPRNQICSQFKVIADRSETSYKLYTI